jgi:bifunctional non-homologous end joining protein LigD
MSDALEIDAGGRTVEVSRPGKVLFPEAGITKGDLAKYWLKVAKTALPHYHDRALSLERYPDGIEADGFYQKHAPEHFPDWIRRAELPKEGGTVVHVIADDLATLVYLADQGAITPHLALSRLDAPDRPDRLVIDLDPSDDDFAKVQAAARAARDLLRRLKATPFVQTTGSRGLHVVQPLDRSADFDAARVLAQALAARLADDAPDRFTTARRKADRGDRVYLDVGRNAFGQTAVAPYAPRARPGAPVATPLEWDEALDPSTGPRDWSVASIPRRLGQKADPWAVIGRHGVSVEALSRRLEALG